MESKAFRSRKGKEKDLGKVGPPSDLDNPLLRLREEVRSRPWRRIGR